MHAAIKCLEDTLLIRRLQAREMGYDKDGDRQTAIIRDIESLARGLSALKANETNAQHPTPTVQCRMKNEEPGVKS